MIKVKDATTKTPTDHEIIEVLARKMGWRIKRREDGVVFAFRGKGEHPIVLGYLDCSLECWNPLTDLNAIYEIEERLTPKQQVEYGFALYDELGLWGLADDEADMTWMIRHASARTCALALYEVLK